MSSGVRATPLVWKSVPVDEGELITQRRTAPGRFPGWQYDLVKIGNRWSATFTDDSRFQGVNRTTTLVDGVLYAEAQAEVNRHHQHPGF